jgi:hypothetical protein
MTCGAGRTRQSICGRSVDEVLSAAGSVISVSPGGKGKDGKNIRVSVTVSLSAALYYTILLYN